MLMIRKSEMFKVLSKDKDSRGRVGELKTAHGVLETPAYAIVGTHGFVKEVSTEDLENAHAEILMMNTYHLWRDLGEENLNTFDGLHASSGWEKPLMTDSGGFQVFSMGVAREHKIGKVFKKDTLDNDKNFRAGSSAIKVSEGGVHFTKDNEEHFLNPEKSIWIQERLGADMMFAFDDPSSPMDSREKTKESMERTHRWAERCLKAKTKNRQLFYGIIQGGPFEDLRIESAKIIGEMDFGGFAIGGAFGTSFGDTQEATYKELDWTIPYLPKDKPRHWLGFGKVEDVFRGVEAGIDTFDCVIPTREGRHGGVWTKKERVNILAGSFKGDNMLLEEECGCYACSVKKITRGELYDFFKLGKSAPEYKEAEHLSSIHNIYFFNNLMGEIREAIKEGKFKGLKKKYL